MQLAVRGDYALRPMVPGAEVIVADGASRIRENKRRGRMSRHLRPKVNKHVRAAARNIADVEGGRKQR